jgi:hypothetical protein
MQKAVWQKVAGAIVVTLWTIVALLVVTTGWDDTVTEVYGWWGRAPGPIATSTLLKIIVFSGVSAGACYFFWGQFVEIGRWLKGMIATPHSRPVPSGGNRTNRAEPLPSNSLNLEQVKDQIVRYVKNHRIPQALSTTLEQSDRLYMGLRNGNIKCWGHAAKYFPPKTDPPFPEAVQIEASFWNDHLIEEVEMWRVRIADTKGATAWKSITLPDPDRFDDRTKVPCYWNLQFSKYDVADIWRINTFV